MVRGVIRTERYKRGPLGWFFLFVFCAFNGWMLYVTGRLFWMMADVGLLQQEGAPAPAIVTLVVIWGTGALIFGVLMYVTRGTKIITEEIPC